MNRWSWLLVIVGCLALFVSLHDWKRSDASQATQPASAGEPDLYMEKATITQYADDGSVRYHLQSSEVRHYEDEGLTRMVSPTLTLNRAPQPPWFARADRGFVHDADTAGSKSGEVILLRDNVHLEQREPNSVEIQSSTLTVYPDRQFAETDQPVIIDSATGHSTAVGLSGDLGTGLFKLSSDATQRVHTIVMPDQFQRATKKPPQ